MTVQCIACANFMMRGSRMAREGYGHCSKGRPYEYMSAVYERSCASHLQHDDKTVAERKAWLEGCK